MRLHRAIATAALGLLTAIPSAAFADTPLWGYFVNDEAGEFVTGDWPHDTLVTFGSSPDADVTLDGLEPIHATVGIDGDSFELDAKGTVWVGGAPVSGQTEFEPNTPVRMGSYNIRFRLAEGESVEPVPPEPLLDEDGHEIIDYSYPPTPHEGAGRAAIARKLEFSRDGYRFCHHDDFGEDGVVGADFCAIFDESTYEVCPSVRETCPWEERQIRTVFGQFSEDHGEGGKGKGKGKGKPKRRRERTLKLPAVPPIVAYGVLGLIIVVLVGWFIKQLMDAGWEKSELDLAEEEIDEAMLDLQSLPQARSHVLLKLAERALARGDAEEASVLAHLAILRHLDDEGLARYHPSKTNGDYLRAIRRQKPLAKLFRGIANQTERVRFGDGFVDAEQLRTQLTEARILLVPGSDIPSASAAAPLVLIALLGMSAQSCLVEDDSRAFYSHGPAGMAAFAATLREAGFTTEIKLDPLDEVPVGVKTVVLRTSSTRTGRFPPELNIDDLLDRGMSIVVLDDLGRAPEFLPGTSTSAPTSVTVDAVALHLPADKHQTECALRIQNMGTAAWTKDVKVPRGAVIDISDHNGVTSVSRDVITIEPLFIYDETPLDHTRAAALAIQRNDDNGDAPGCLYVFSDRDLFTNASLTRLANARFLGAFFGAIAQGDKRIYIVERLERWSKGGGGGQDNPTKPLSASNLFPLLLQGLVSLALLYIFIGAAFGPLRDPTHNVRKSFVEHVEAIGRQYARCGLPGLNHAAGSLARLVVMRNRERVRGGGAGWGGVARELAEKHDLPEEDVRAALRLGIEGKSELGAPKLEDPSPSSERMLRTLSKLLGGRSADPALKPRRAFRRKNRSA